jgi:transcriptional regulator with XRE-family HTH domain
MGTEIKLHISELRKKKNITQEELATQLGISFQSVSKWETGTSLPDVTMLPKIAEIFDVSVDYVLGLKSSKSIATEVAPIDSIQANMKMRPEKEKFKAAFEISTVLYEGIATNGYRNDINEIFTSTYPTTSKSTFLCTEKEGFVACLTGLSVFGSFAYLVKPKPDKTKQMGLLFSELADLDKLALLIKMVNSAFDNDNMLLTKSEVFHLSGLPDERTLVILKDFTSIGILTRTVNDNEEVCYKFPDGSIALLMPIIILCKALSEAN